MEFRTIVVAGASRGIGLAVAEHLQPRTKRLVTVSRTQAPVGEWIAADLSELNGVEKVTHTIGSDRLDALLLYMGKPGKPMHLPVNIALKTVLMQISPG